jgi:NAD+ synthase
MELSGEIFKIDAAVSIERLLDFIRQQLSALHRDGILVPFSGGLDSSTVLLLCARAAGKDRVTALLMPEKQGNPEAERYARILTDQFQIKTVTRDLSPILSSIGTYKFLLSGIPFHSVRNWLTRAFLKRSKTNPFLKIMQGQAGSLEREGYAKYLSKQRIRVVVEYLIAEEMNFLVAGCAHKSEDMVGLFVKFGVDDLADIMPLKNLYRSHILQLAESLGVPQEILSRTPNPDIIPGVSDKYVDILGLSYDTLDLVLYGIDHGMEDVSIAEQLHLPPGKVQEIRSLVVHTAHMRSPSLSLTWE